MSADTVGLTFCAAVCDLTPDRPGEILHRLLVPPRHTHAVNRSLSRANGLGRDLWSMVSGMKYFRGTAG
jgi:hypothetical protein